MSCTLPLSLCVGIMYVYTSPISLCVGIAVAYRGDGRQIAVSTLRAGIVFFDSDTSQQTGSIEARADLGYVRKSGESVTAKKASASKYDAIVFLVF